MTKNTSSFTTTTNDPHSLQARAGMTADAVTQGRGRMRAISVAPAIPEDLTIDVPNLVLNREYLINNVGKNVSITLPTVGSTYVDTNTYAVANGDIITFTVLAGTLTVEDSTSSYSYSTTVLEDADIHSVTFRLLDSIWYIVSKGTLPLSRQMVSSSNFMTSVLANAAAYTMVKLDTLFSVDLGFPGYCWKISDKAIPSINSDLVFIDGKLISSQGNYAWLGIGANGEPTALDVVEYYLYINESITDENLVQLVQTTDITDAVTHKILKAAITDGEFILTSQQHASLLNILDNYEYLVTRIGDLETAVASLQSSMMEVQTDISNLARTGIDIRILTGNTADTNGLGKMVFTDALPSMSSLVVNRSGLTGTNMNNGDNVITLHGLIRTHGNGWDMGYAMVSATYTSGATVLLMANASGHYIYSVFFPISIPWPKSESGVTITCKLRNGTADNFEIMLHSATVSIPPENAEIIGA